LKDHDSFGEKNYPHPEAFAHLAALTEAASKEYAIPWHRGKTFSVDTIFAEFAHLEEVLSLGCDSIEMETAAFFKAAAISGLKAAALYVISDNIYQGKSVYSREERIRSTWNLSGTGF
jgi:purine-nucleoside phosphorylase